MKIIELTVAYDKKPIAFNSRHIVCVEPVRTTDELLTHGAKSYVCTVNMTKFMVMEDYESIVRMLAGL